MTRVHPAEARWKRLTRHHAGAFILGGFTTALLGVCAAGVVLWSGRYDVSAINQHLRPTYAILDVGLRRSVAYRAHGIEAPRLDDAKFIAQGEACFRLHCEQCHGGPGVARSDFALGMMPVPSSLSQASRDWTPAQLYWITAKGIKMTGMPAWEYRMHDRQLWSVVAFLLVLPQLRPEEYRMRMASARGACERESAAAIATGDPDRGRMAIQQFACTACHVIPGIVGPESHVGPPLKAMGRRQYIAGVIPNTPDNLQRWLRTPHSISERTAMPDLGVSDDHAKDMAAFLARLE